MGESAMTAPINEGQETEWENATMQNRRFSCGNIRLLSLALILVLLLSQAPPATGEVNSPSSSSNHIWVLASGTEWCDVNGVGVEFPYSITLDLTGAAFNGRQGDDFQFIGNGPISLEIRTNQPTCGPVLLDSDHFISDNFGQIPGLPPVLEYSTRQFSPDGENSYVWRATIAEGGFPGKYGGSDWGAHPQGGDIVIILHTSWALGSKTITIRLDRPGWIKVTVDDQRQMEACLFEYPKGAPLPVSGESMDFSISGGTVLVYNAKTDERGCISGGVFLPESLVNDPKGILRDLDAKTDRFGSTLGVSAIARIQYGRVHGISGIAQVVRANGTVETIRDGDTVFAGDALRLIPDLSNNIFSPSVEISFSDGTEVISHQTHSAPVPGLGTRLVIGSGGNVGNQPGSLATWFIDAKEDPNMVIDVAVRQGLNRIVLGGFGWVIKTVGGQVISYLAKPHSGTQLSSAQAAAVDIPNGLTDTRIVLRGDGAALVHNQGSPIELTTSGSFSAVQDIRSGQELAIPANASGQADLNALTDACPPVAADQGLEVKITSPLPGDVISRTPLIQLALTWDEATSPRKDLALEVRLNGALRTGYFDCLGGSPQGCTWQPAAELGLGAGDNQITATLADLNGNRSQAGLVVHAPDAPSPPLALKGLGANDMALLDWNPAASPDVAGYNLYRANGGGTPTRLNDQPTAGSAWLDDGVSNGNAYTYTVRAVTGSGVESDDSAPVSVTVTALSGTGAPDAPLGLTAELGDGRARLTWQSGSGTTVAYRVYSATLETGPYALLLGGAPFLRQEAVDRTVANGSMRWYQVTALDSTLVESPPSSQRVSAQPVALPPAAPQGLTAYSANGQATLAWDPNSEPDLNGYRVYRSSGTGTGDLRATLLKAQTVYTDPVAYNQSFSYWVTAVDQAALESQPSDSAPVSSGSDPAHCAAPASFPLPPIVRQNEPPNPSLDAFRYGQFDNTWVDEQGRLSLVTPARVTGWAGSYLNTDRFHSIRNSAPAAAGPFLYLLGGYLVGGSSASDLPSFETVIAPLEDTGALAISRKATLTLPIRVADASAVAFGGSLYLLGGHKRNLTGSSVEEVSNEVYRAVLAPDGEAGPWQPASSLPVPLYGASAVAWHGGLYLFGGRDATDQTRAECYRAGFQADGSLTPWTACDPLPEALYRPGVTAGQGRLFVVGGIITGTQASQHVWSTAVDDSTGALGDWSAETDLPVGVAGNRAVVSHGRLLVAGPWISPWESDSLLSARMLVTGTLGGWENDPPLPFAAEVEALVSTEGQVYAITAGYLTAYRAVFSPAPQDGQLPGVFYSAPRDLIFQTPVSGLEWQANPGNQWASVAVRTAVGPEWGSWSSPSTTPPIPLSGNPRYVQVKARLAPAPGASPTLLDWIGVHLDLPPGSQPNPHSQMIGTAGGVLIVGNNAVRLIVPPGAVPTDTIFTIAPSGHTPYFLTNVVTASGVFELSARRAADSGYIRDFNQSLSLETQYDPASVRDPAAKVELYMEDDWGWNVPIPSFPDLVNQHVVAVFAQIDSGRFILAWEQEINSIYLPLILR
jgi:hypothetical protein